MRRSPSRQPKRSSPSQRIWFVELLEDRRLLDAGSAVATPAAALVAPSHPWQNPILPLDVNKDGVVSPFDVLLVVDRLMTLGVGPVPAADPKNPPTVYYDTDGDNFISPVDALRVIDRLSSPPTVTISTLMPISADVTPQVTVGVTSSAPLANGLQVQVDVDLNSNGSFTDPGETNYSQATLVNGAAIFDLTPALPRDRSGAAYQVRLQAHVQDGDGIVGFSPVLALTINTTVSNALAAYVQTPDPTYTYTLKSTYHDPSGLYTIYDVSMTSQTWRTTADVNTPLWQHWERIIVPTGPVLPTALLMIDGGSYSTTLPGVDQSIIALAGAAVELRAVTIDLKDVPNEPLTFTGDPGNPRTEDAILAYTYDQFMNHIGQPGNDTWPALLPMVKSAVRAMDTVQTFVSMLAIGDTINNFMVTGYSKRGWTTWLTAAIDNRVMAIIPGVFDNLDQGPQMVHHFNVYGMFSPAVQDYTNLNIFSRFGTSEGEQLSEIVDPYRYLNQGNGRFDNMPKLLINSAGDEFFVSDSAQFYIHDLPGTQNYLRYIVPTSAEPIGHKLNPIDPIISTVSFYAAVVNNLPLPKFSWQVTPNGSIRVQTVDAPSQVLLWQATNPVARDFRHAYNPGIVWTSTALTDQGGGVYVGSTPMPDSGATAFFVELTFPSFIPSAPYIFTTEIHVNSMLPLYPWPYSLSSNSASAGAVAGAAAADLNGIAFAVTAQGGAGTAAFAALASAGPPPAPLDGGSASNVANRPDASVAMAAAVSSQDTRKSWQDESNTLLVDHVFAGTLDDVLA